MKFIHLADLHLGKKLNEFSLIEDQKYIVNQIMQHVADEQPDAVILAGDIYDKSIPSAEAVRLFDAFLTDLVSAHTKVLIISGNHDSAERIDFGSSLFDKSGVYVAGVYDGNEHKVVLHDEYGEVNCYLIPFIKPIHVKQTLEEDEAAQITNYHEAMAKAVEQLHVDDNARNVLVAHQFVTGAQTAGSEAVNVGGLDNIGADVFDAFDYVALGHIHGAQNVGSERVRYAGTPLKYSFSEWQQQKTLTVAKLGKKGELTVKELPLTPLRELRKVRGAYDEVMNSGFYKDWPMDESHHLVDFYSITLTDEDDVIDAAAKLRSVYRNLLQMEYDNKRMREDAAIEVVDDLEHKTSLELVDDFFASRNNVGMNAEQRTYVQALLEELEARA